MWYLRKSPEKNLLAEVCRNWVIWFYWFYYCAEQKFVSLVTSLFKNPVRSGVLNNRPVIFFTKQKTPSSTYLLPAFLFGPLVLLNLTGSCFCIIRIINVYFMPRTRWSINWHRNFTYFLHVWFLSLKWLLLGSVYY